MRSVRVWKQKKSMVWPGRAVLLVFVWCCLVPPWPVKAHAETLPKADNEMLTDEHYALPGFSSPLPLLVLELPEDTVAKEEDGCFLSANLWSFEGHTENTLERVPAFSLQAGLRNMTEKTNSAPNKDDYYLQLDGEYGLLGLPAGDEFLLLGGGKDKSLIRNYIGHVLGSETMNTPVATQFCEVFYRSADGDLYQGVYLLVKLQPHENAVLFHRGAGENGIPVETFSTQNDPAAAGIFIPCVESAHWDDRLSEPIGQFSAAEAVLYSMNPATFYTYPERFDVPSFIASFILGEVTQNYAGMQNAWYCLDLGTGKLAAAPIWNFEEAFDNEARAPAVIDQIQYDEAPYYTHLFKSPQFARQVQEAYLQLLRGPLNEAALDALADDAAAIVAPAVERDWSRWDNYESHRLLPLTEVETDDGAVEEVEPFNRQTTTWQRELVRLKTNLRQHSLQMAQRLTQFDFSEREISREIVLTTNPLWVAIYLVVFFALVRFARRYGA